jgi:hypothetical protein
LTLGYLDDLTVGDNQTEVAADVLRIKDIGDSIGLSLNISKCELVCHPNAVIVDSLLQSFTPRNTDQATLLGPPLFTGPELDLAWSTRLVELERAVERLSMLGAQEALVLLL